MTPQVTPMSEIPWGVWPYRDAPGKFAEAKCGSAGCGSMGGADYPEYERGEGPVEQVTAEVQSPVPHEAEIRAAWGAYAVAALNGHDHFLATRAAESLLTVLCNSCIAHDFVQVVYSGGTDGDGVLVSGGRIDTSDTGWFDLPAVLAAASVPAQ